MMERQLRIEISDHVVATCDTPVIGDLPVDVAAALNSVTMSVFTSVWDTQVVAEAEERQAAVEEANMEYIEEMSVSGESYRIAAHSRAPSRLADIPSVEPFDVARIARLLANAEMKQELFAIASLISSEEMSFSRIAITVEKDLRRRAVILLIRVRVDTLRMRNEEREAFIKAGREALHASGKTVETLRSGRRMNFQKPT